MTGRTVRSRLGPHPCSPRPAMGGAGFGTRTSRNQHAPKESPPR
jgi:hypothetical protein